MEREEFIKFIESIGFVQGSFPYVYTYKKFRIHFQYADGYSLNDGFKWITNILYKDFKIIEKYFKKEIRSIKLKQLLGESRLISKI